MPVVLSGSQLPALQLSINVWQAILNQRLMWMQTPPATGFATIDIEGQAVAYQSPRQNIDLIHFLERQIAVLSRRRPIFSSMNLGRAFG
jgi:hypothetical protein